MCVYGTPSFSTKNPASSSFPGSIGDPAYQQPPRPGHQQRLPSPSAQVHHEVHQRTAGGEADVRTGGGGAGGAGGGAVLMESKERGLVRGAPVLKGARTIRSSCLDGG